MPVCFSVSTARVNVCNVIKVVRWASEGVIIKPQVVLPFDLRVGKQMLCHRDEVIGDNFYLLLGT
jgi:hypothetical protein